MSKKNLINILDKADKDLDAFPFWASFKKACSENPIKDLIKRRKIKYLNITSDI